jgi:hypothetical protein
MSDIKREIDLDAITKAMMDGSMSLAEGGEEIQCKGYIHRTWLPSKPTNQSKLELHYWDGHKWIGTSYVRFVPYGR